MLTVSCELSISTKDAMGLLYITIDWIDSDEEVRVRVLVRNSLKAMSGKENAYPRLPSMGIGAAMLHHHAAAANKQATQETAPRLTKGNLNMPHMTKEEPLKPPKNPREMMESNKVNYKEPVEKFVKAQTSQDKGNGETMAKLLKAPLAQSTLKVSLPVKLQKTRPNSEGSPVTEHSLKEQTKTKNHVGATSIPSQQTTNGDSVNTPRNEHSAKSESGGSKKEAGDTGRKLDSLVGRSARRFILVSHVVLLQPTKGNKTRWDGALYPFRRTIWVHAVSLREEIVLYLRYEVPGLGIGGYDQLTPAALAWNCYLQPGQGPGVCFLKFRPPAPVLAAGTSLLVPGLVLPDQLSSNRGWYSDARNTGEATRSSSRPEEGCPQYLLGLPCDLTLGIHWRSPSNRRMDIAAWRMDPPDIS
uniref:Uncharacterized protein n=1 Tax=Timema monikensis TaxID=170555 RepID=A0A7R9EEL5_9NEOP|nr:unnamed protein product [Timema monikensis]